MATPDKKDKKDEPISNALLAMMVCSVVGAVMVAASFWVINYWPLPVAVAPYYDWNVGLLWGFIVGGSFGWVIGWMTDEKHFNDSTY